MVLTTLRVCLLQLTSNTISHSLDFKSIALPLMLLCIPLLTGCGDAGNVQFADLSVAKAGNAGSTISLNPTSFAFSVTQGDPNPVHTVSISNSGKGQLNWSMSTTASWLTVSPSTGTASGNASDTVTATANLSGLAAGTYSATITVFGVGATNNGQDIPVTLTIAAAASSTSQTSTSTATSSSTSTTPTSTSTTTTSTSTTTTTASAALSWAAETDPTVTGYYVHYGTQSPNSMGSCAYAYSVYYSLTSLASAALPTATISSLTTGTTYYFAVSAYNGNESLCSNEVAKAT